MKALIGNPSSLDLPRFTQLINKSNQFNLRTQRYSDAAIVQMAGDKSNYSLLCISLEDKFGKYGLISCIILKHLQDIAFIDTWVMSCRVLKRGVEKAAFSAIIDVARSRGCRWIGGEYILSKKNQLVAGLLPEMGFELAPEGWFVHTDDNSVLYRIDGESAMRKDHYILVKNENSWYV
jgi:FkbH-like protein